jgi:hypothetical protein
LRCRLVVGHDFGAPSPLSRSRTAGVCIAASAMSCRVLTIGAPDVACC